MKKVLFLISCFSVGLNAVPKTVFIVRHGEKTEKKEPVRFEQWYFKDSKPLSVRGWQRAYALVPYFSMDSAIIEKYGHIKALFAPKPDNFYKSVRPIQTITPLSKALHMDINSYFALDHNGIPGLVKHIKEAESLHNEVVLIAYEHDHIPDLLKAFKVKNYLTKWPNNVFDWVVILEFDTRTGECVAYSIQPQQLLFGDSGSTNVAPTVA